MIARFKSRLLCFYLILYILYVLFCISRVIFVVVFSHGVYFYSFWIQFFVVFFLFLFTFLDDKSFLFSFGFSSKNLVFLNEIDYVIEIYGDYLAVNQNTDQTTFTGPLSPDH